MECLALGLDAKVRVAPIHEPDRLLQADVDLPGHRARERVVAALDLAVGLAPRQLDVQFLRVGHSQRRGRRRLRDRRQQQLRLVGDARAPKPLRDRLVVRRLREFDVLSELVDDLGGRVAVEPLAAEDQVGHVGAQAELLG